MTRPEVIEFLDAASKVEHGILMPPYMRAPLAAVLREAAEFVDSHTLGALELDKQLELARAINSGGSVARLNEQIREGLRA